VGEDKVVIVEGHTVGSASRFETHIERVGSSADVGVDERHAFTNSVGQLLYALRDNGLPITSEPMADYQNFEVPISLR